MLIFKLIDLLYSGFKIVVRVILEGRANREVKESVVMC